MDEGSSRVISTKTSFPCLALMEILCAMLSEVQDWGLENSRTWPWIKWSCWFICFIIAQMFIRCLALWCMLVWQHMSLPTWMESKSLLHQKSAPLTTQSCPSHLRIITGDWLFHLCITSLSLTQCGIANPRTVMSISVASPQHPISWLLDILFVICLYCWHLLHAMMFCRKFFGFCLVNFTKK